MTYRIILPPSLRGRRALPPRDPVVKKIGRPTINGHVMNWAELKRRSRGKTSEDRKRMIAVLDMETDPFDAAHETIVKPFLAVLYSDEFETVIIWQEDYGAFVREVIAAIRALPGKFTIYAHNGGKFDFMFLVHELRGSVSFKGRGIMSATIGAHELRDSFHIIPERLANLQKELFDYSKLKRNRRGKYKSEIIAYCVSDCRNLLDYIKKFVEEFGLKISIGQAAMAELRKCYDVEKMNANDDAYIRRYFFGGRVECLQGRGRFVGAYKVFDVNSMYPFAMASFQHPIGNAYVSHAGPITPHTIFLEVECRNHGALLHRLTDGERKGEITAEIPEGVFLTTIWEYEAALALHLIENVRVQWCVDCYARSDFSEFVLPLNAKKVVARQGMDASVKESAPYHALKKDYTFYKLILNNAYGKFAQNPRNFKEFYFTSPDDVPPAAWMKSIYDMPPGDRLSFELPSFRHASYWIWEKPAPRQYFNNVGTAASITGAARSMLLRAIHKARDPIYCDTDSLICRELPDVPLHQSELGAWKLEKELTEVLIVGKKLYAYRGHDGAPVIRSKGTSGLEWDDMLRLIEGERIAMSNFGPTLNRFGDQYYLEREIRATAPFKGK
jgi:DNA polymerase type B, organellar and viral